MRIGIHLLDLTPGQIGGLEQYVRNLLAYTIRQFEQYEIFLFLRNHNIDSFSDRSGNVFKILIDGKEERNAQLHRWIRGLNLNVWFCPLLVLEPLDVGIPSVVTIPDLQHEVYPEFFDPSILQWRLKNYKESAEKSSAVLTLSNYSKQMIVKTYNVAKEKVHAIHLDSSREFYQELDEERNREVIRKYGLPDQYGYYPANTWPHKNHLRLLEAVRILKQRHHIPIKIVFTGSRHQEHSSISNYIREHDLSGQIYVLDYIPQDEMPYLYKNADFLVFPSLFEGFGIPLVEAMRMKTPILCSNSTSIPEIVGDCALLFDPHNPEDIAAKMLQIRDDAVRKDLIRKGLRKSGKFSWNKCAQATLQVISKLPAVKNI